MSYVLFFGSHFHSDLPFGGVRLEGDMYYTHMYVYIYIDMFAVIAAIGSSLPEPGNMVDICWLGVAPC